MVKTKLQAVVNDQIFWIAKVFYRLKKSGMPRGFNAHHKTWVHFLRARLRMKSLGTLTRGQYKTYLMAQFVYAPGRDRDRVWPNMLYSAGARQKWEWYLKRKQRRLGTVMPRAVEYEKSLSTTRLRAVFEQCAWDLEGLVRSGFSEVEALRGFESRFDPSFILSSLGACVRLRDDLNYYGPRVRAVYAEFSGRTKALALMRILYAQCREREQRRWGERIALRRLQLPNIHAGRERPDPPSGSMGSRPDIPCKA